ncbi:MAG: 5-methyltetrahydropteroyltriglutamate--homocysteine S-methyltransferase, partial [Aquihabitans sp.]
MTTTANLGFPRVGATRELKWALERAWREDRYDELRATAASLRCRHWTLQRERGIGRVPVGDFSLYDHVLDAALAVGAVPERFGGRPFDPESGDDDDLRRYFMMARGGRLGGADRAPLELTKWLDTNYHYLVPELAPVQVFAPRPSRMVAHLREATSLGVAARPVLLGPVSLLGLAKRTDGGEPIGLLDRLLPAYTDLVARLRAEGAAYFQFDEPLLVTDLDPQFTRAYRRAYASLRDATGDAEVTLATYFGPLGDNTELATSLPVDVLHLDLVRGRDQLDAVIAARPDTLALSLGLVDGRNIWRSDLDALIPIVAHAIDRLGSDGVQLAPSCSLLHLPVD